MCEWGTREAGLGNLGEGMERRGFMREKGVEEGRGGTVGGLLKLRSHTDSCPAGT